MVVVAIHIKVETKALLKAAFAFIFGFGQTLEMTGIDARVNKPMLFFRLLFVVICVFFEKGHQPRERARL